LADGLFCSGPISASKEGRAMVIDAMNSLKETLDEAILRAVKNRKKPM
jgi:hypothetical protein